LAVHRVFREEAELPIFSKYIRGVKLGIVAKNASLHSVFSATTWYSQKSDYVRESYIYSKFFEVLGNDAKKCEKRTIKSHARIPFSRFFTDFKGTPIFNKNSYFFCYISIKVECQLQEAPQLEDESTITSYRKNTY
jgi:hypothetical protein